MQALTQRLIPVLLAAALLAAPGGAWAQQLFALDDVRGDDDGNGSLIYPNTPDMQKGDLDLVRVTAEQRGDGVWFVVEMGQTVRSPVGRATKLGQTPLDQLARNGFYTFNVDIYVDTDRVGGSGQTGTVPGRGVTVDRQFAWEKCIVLTPRPDTARTMLQMYFDTVFEADLRAKQGKVSKDELGELEGRSEARVNDLFFFPNKVRVSGRKVEFLVPTDFMGGVPSKSWAYTVVVTGADLEQAGQTAQLNSDKARMMTMGVGRGIGADRWGMRSEADEATPPVVDVLASDPKTQAEVLSNYDMVSGRLAAVPGIAPDGNVAVAASGEEPTPDQLARIDLGLTPAAGPTATKAPAERRTVPARLRTLNQLLAEGLITQAEYNEMRRKILAEL
jgi:hypothetical protein